MSTKVIFVVDFSWEGHHPTYFKYLTKTLLDLGYSVITFCPNPDELREWMNSYKKYDNLFKCYEIHKPPKPNISINKLRTSIHIINLWKRTKLSIESVCTSLKIRPDLVFFPWLDSFLGGNLVSPIIDFIFPYSWSGIYFQPRHLREVKKFSFLRKGPLNPHSLLSSSNCKSVGVLDEGVSYKLNLSKPIIVLPDFADSSSPDLNFEILPLIKEKAGKRKIVALLGALDKRKGLLSLLEIAKVDSSLFFVFAGRLSKGSFTNVEVEKIKDFIDSNPSNCFFYLEFIPGEPQFNALIKACDILYAIYDYPHSSNILTKAAIFEKPVVASQFHCVGERMKKYNIGKALSPGSVNECISAIKTLTLEQDSEKPQRGFDFTLYREIHSIERFSKQIKVLLSEI